MHHSFKSEIVDNSQDRSHIVWGSHLIEKHCHMKMRFPLAGGFSLNFRQQGIWAVRIVESDKSLERLRRLEPVRRRIPVQINPFVELIVALEEQIVIHGVQGVMGKS